MYAGLRELEEAAEALGVDVDGVLDDLRELATQLPPQESDDYQDDDRDWATRGGVIDDMREIEAMSGHLGEA